MTDVAARLVANLVAVFSTYVVQRLEEQGLKPPETLAGALREGEKWLRATLEELLALPYGRQSRGPLEVFQESMRFPSEALAAAGVEAIARGPGAQSALPGDVYNLAPASSRLLGDEAWEAHLAWGAAKARALDQSRLVGLLSANLMDRARIEIPVRSSGRRLVAMDDHAPGSEWPEGRVPGLVVADLAVPDVVAAIERLALAGVRVIAYGPHVDRRALRRAQEAGADEVLSRSAFFAKLSDLLG